MGSGRDKEEERDWETIGGGEDGLKGEKLNGEKVINIIIKGVNGNV